MEIARNCFDPPLSLAESKLKAKLPLWIAVSNWLGLIIRCMHIICFNRMFLGEFFYNFIHLYSRVGCKADCFAIICILFCFYFKFFNYFFLYRILGQCLNFLSLATVRHLSFEDQISIKKHDLENVDHPPVDNVAWK